MNVEHLFSRREMMRGLGLVTLGLGINGLARQAHGAPPESGKNLPQQGTCVLPPLPYAYDSLEPLIDKETLAIHHDKHHAGYVRGLNQAWRELSGAREADDYSLIKHWSRELAFHTSGHVLHSLYWENMSPGGGAAPKGELAEAINKSFGSFTLFKHHFMAATEAVEGSGWGIMALEPYRGYLVILQAEKHQDLAIWGVYPLLVCDVWEHAYYLKYQNRRPEYVTNWWNVVNWDEVARRFAAAA